MAASYGKTVGGSLKLKGGFSLKPAKEKKHKRERAEEEGGARVEAPGEAVAAPSAADAEPDRLQGIGRLITSGA